MVTTPSSSKLRWRRLGTRLLMFGAILLGALVVIYIAGERERQRVLQDMHGRLDVRIAHSADQFLHQLEARRREVRFLASLPPVAGIVRASVDGVDRLERTPLSSWQSRLEAIFSNYMTANPGVFQVRFIGVADHGRELHRVERRVGQQVAVAPKDLQQKGDTPYFRATAKLEEGQVYVSDLTLNREHGKVQLPQLPTIRVATPVFGADARLFGMIVVNYDAAALLAMVQGNAPAGGSTYRSNAAGDFLLHPEPGRSFGFEFGRRWRWQDEFKLAAQGQADMLVVRSRQGLQYLRGRDVALDPNAGQRVLTMHFGLPQRLVDAAVFATYTDTALAMLACFAIFAIAAMPYRRQQRRASDYQARMAAIVDSSHDAIIGKTLDGVVTSWNKGAEMMFGYSAARALGRTLTELIVPDDARDEEAMLLGKLGRGEAVLDFNTRRQRSDGSLLTVSLTLSPIRAMDGSIVGAAKTVRDISIQADADARIQAINASLEQQVRARTADIAAAAILQAAILDNAAHAVFATDLDGTVVLFNPAAERLLGYGASEVIGQHTPAQWLDPGQAGARAAQLSVQAGMTVAPGFAAFSWRALHGLDDESETTLVRRDGTTLVAQLSVNALHGADGAVSGFLGIASDMSARIEDRRQVIAARDQLQTASDIAELGIWTWDLADGKLEWNERMHLLYQSTPVLRASGLYYQHWRACVHPDDVAATEAKLQGALDGSGQYDPIFRIVRDDGSERFIQAAASVERDAAGKAMRVLGINRDITEQRQREQDLQAAKAEADAASLAKSQFLANMSHEIRSPMNAVLGMLMLLKQSALNARQFDYADKAETAGRSLLGILNDILDFSKVEAGKMEIDPAPFSLDKLLRDLAVVLATNVGDKPLEIVYEVAPALPDWLVGDALRLQQVLLNLAGNAVKFTAQGEVVVAVGMQQAHDDAGSVVLAFSVRDTGIGIAPEQRQRIFDGFAQAEASTARRYGGSGLGLAISRRLVAMLGGTLEIDSELGRGSTFRFAIPFARAAAPAPVAPVDALALQRLRVMVIDDHDAARESLASMLASFGWHVDAFEGGVQALAALEQGGPRHDAIFIDWMMPGLDGWATAEQIRTHFPGASPPLVVMVTAHGRDALARRQRDAGQALDGFLVKPVTASMVFDSVADALSARHGAPVQPPPAGRHLAQSRLAGLRVLLVDDNLTNQQVASELLGNDGAEVVVADCAAAAIAALTAPGRFDCVLMDIQMPDMDGYEATGIIRGQLGMASLPVIAMTANAMASDRAQALAAGMNDHVGKPFDLDMLIAVIVRHTGRTGAPVEPGACATAPAASHMSLDAAGALKRLGGNRVVFGRALQIFVRESALLLAQLPRAAQEVIPERDANVLHSLYGVAATVGANHGAMLAKTLEQALRRGDHGARWGALYADLAGALQQASVAACQLAAELAPEGHQGGGGQPGAGVRIMLVQLHALLSKSDLAALALFEQLRCDEDNTDAPGLSELGQAIDQLDFVAATRCCATMIGRLEHASP